ncbi:MAG: biopolymer transporter ExbD [gamma proteobacterium symbiont of Ctena orbiculata]|uniref:Biopolymer transporter ExbD n=1 Tax=Candidatus Thiodiazotropha taylori TaxID=2792791 RepID=A0A944MA43_9GAMM|nr:biopolymer transporter ExbD [Candidatus Thiodiazotropha taylori]PUB90274.1 MAG: biopolymer transporter ExbD [gamma proteobacterium symbiont of Ctena orbiculata]MBT2990119.1 biopolymer transporter ExbD [Candidatus Thiodiazotropha taylori]MBT2997861.1 biopolymer transporter ExbD [Candidatus Thiodiazotropha taylori]MBT3001649.1 biopolymer transporter ExbD [Candidatus Thiodiazotropha taylori]
MKMSRRAKRMDRHHRRNKGHAVLNLVSLMDIFTILVFFLLVNSGEVQVLPNAKALSLPESVATLKPKETLVVMVNHNEILVQGYRVMDLTRPLPTGTTLPALKEELQRHADRSKSRALEPFKGKITIMGEKSIPYTLLKRVMATCAESDYPHVSLAVLRKNEKPEGGQPL